MRWKSQEIYPPKHYRVIKRFLFFPKSLRTHALGSFETRWLEFAQIHQTRIEKITHPSEYYWRVYYWADYSKN